MEKAEKGLRDNKNKPQWSLVCLPTLEPMIKVLEFGKNKYGLENWKKGLDKKEILESLQRHLVALFEGEEIDKESGLDHIGHVLCNAMFYSYERMIEQDKIKRPESK
jgi:hypothetical protein